MYRPTPPRRGQTLLELMVASALVALAVVPALTLIRRSVELGREVETRGVLATLCVSKLEENLALAAATWTSGTQTGGFSAEGYASYRYEVQRSELEADGGLPDRLMAVSATVWEDADGGGALGANEIQITLRSKIAKMARYIDGED